MNSVPCVAADIATLVVHNSVSSVHGTSVGYLGPNAAARGVCIRAGTKPSQSDSPFIAVAASYLLSGSMTEASQDGELPTLNPYGKMCPYSCKCTTHVNLNQEFGATRYLQWRVGERWRVSTLALRLAWKSCTIENVAGKWPEKAITGSCKPLERLSAGGRSRNHAQDDRIFSPMLMHAYRCLYSTVHH